MIAFLKFVASARTSYPTGSRELAEKVPSLEVVNEMDRLVPVFVIVILALGTTAPLESFTVPPIPPRLV